jgi:hypothetical protein
MLIFSGWMKEEHYLKSVKKFYSCETLNKTTCHYSLTKQQFDL